MRVHLWKILMYYDVLPDMAFVQVVKFAELHSKNEMVIQK